MVATGTASKPEHDSDCMLDCPHETSRLKASLVGQVVYLDPHPYFVLVEEGRSCQLSIWSSRAIPPVFPYAHQRILCLQYGNELDPQVDDQCSDRHVRHNPHADCLVCAAAWLSDDTNSILCVGDDHGKCMSTSR